MTVSGLKQTGTINDLVIYETHIYRRHELVAQYNVIPKAMLP
jgi:hypothetical protein